MRKKIIIKIKISIVYNMNAEIFQKSKLIIISKFQIKNKINI